MRPQPSGNGNNTKHVSWGAATSTIRATYRFSSRFHKTEYQNTDCWFVAVLDQNLPSPLSRSRHPSPKLPHPDTPLRNSGSGSNQISSRSNEYISAATPGIAFFRLPLSEGNRLAKIKVSRPEKQCFDLLSHPPHSFFIPVKHLVKFIFTFFNYALKEKKQQDSYSMMGLIRDLHKGNIFADNL